MYPDGGIARFRLFGIVVPVFPGKSKTVDLAHVANGGLAVAFSDQHFGKASNLLLPGRGIDMGDGWETRRSRGGDHVDWVVVKLGAEGTIEKAVIDTAHFKGNYAKMVKLEALLPPRLFSTAVFNFSSLYLRQNGPRSCLRRNAERTKNIFSPQTSSMWINLIPT